MIENTNECTQTDKDGAIEISLLDILIVIAKYKKFIIKCVLLFAIAGAIFVFFFTKTEYLSQIQMAPLNASSIQNGEFSISVPSEFVAGVVQSDAVLNYTIEKNSLTTDDNGKKLTMLQARKKLGKVIKCDVDKKSGIITVGVKNESPKIAQAVATSLYDATLKVLGNSGILLSNGKDAYLSDEINKNVKKLQRYMSKENSQTSVNNALNDMIKTVTMLSLYDQAGEYRNQIPWVIQLISPATLPDDHEPRGRVVKMALVVLLGLFVGIMGAFIRYLWQLSKSDPETESKLALLKKLI